jgi:hypothetical protein
MVKYPYIHVPTRAGQEAVVRELYALGIESLSRRPLNLQIERMERQDYVTMAGQWIGIETSYGENKPFISWEKGIGPNAIRLNSLRQLKAYLRRHALIPTRD